MSEITQCTEYFDLGVGWVLGRLVRWRKPGQALPADMHAGGASNFHVPLISSVRNLTNDLSPCHALVTKSINGTVKFPPAFSDGTAVPA